MHVVSLGVQDIPNNLLIALDCAGLHIHGVKCQTLLKSLLQRIPGIETSFLLGYFSNERTMSLSKIYCFHLLALRTSSQPHSMGYSTDDTKDKASVKQMKTDKPSKNGPVRWLSRERNLPLSLTN